MEILTNNPAFQHIYEKIFVLLDHKSLLQCRLVNHSWNTILYNPIFWLQKCGSLNARKKICNAIDTKNIHKAWMNLIALQENKNDLTEKRNKNGVTLCLIKIHKYLTVDSFSLYPFLPPLHVAALAGDLNLVKFILENSEDVLTLKFSPLEDNEPEIIQKPKVEVIDVEILIPKAEEFYGWTPMNLAASNGHKEIVKFLASTDVEDLIIPNHFGKTPIHMASINGNRTRQIIFLPLFVQLF